MAKRETIDVRVSRRILWIGSEAYPLQNIARAQTLKLKSKRGSPFANYIKDVMLWVILGVVAIVVINLAKLTSSWPIRQVWVVVVGLLVLSTIRLIVALRRRRIYYALVIETAGTPNTALVSTDESVVNHLVYQIMDAIDNPQAEFQMQVENFHVGDKIQQFGDHNVGKTV